MRNLAPIDQLARWACLHLLRSPVAVLGFVISLLFSADALACPSCAANARETSAAEILWLVLLTVSPLVIGGIVFGVLRRSGAASSDDETSAPK